MVAGLEEISSGEVLIEGRRVNEVAARDRDIAMVFQSYALYPQMTVRENIAFALEMRRLPRTEIARRVEEAARMLDLGSLLDRKPRHLSGGQRQRVAMGRALVRQPKAFLLDEPLSNLDAKLRVQLRAELGRLHERLGVTTIHVTHDQVEAMTLGSRVAVFSAGRLMQYDTPRALYHAPANLFVAGFIGSPAMNFLSAEAAEGGVRLAGLHLPVRARGAAPSPGRPLNLGLRPEHLRWRPQPGPGAFAAQVELIEHLEPESFVMALPEEAGLRALGQESGGATGPLLLRCPADHLPEPRSTIWIEPDPLRAHLFDPDTGLAL
jgi:multiple sugar transport system ATP-binding protein